MNYIIYHILYVLLSVFQLQVNSYTETNSIELKHVKTIKIDKDYSHQNLVNTDKFVVWFELYTYSFHIVDLDLNQTKQIKINKGRGPGESVLIKSAIIVGDDLIVYDMGSMKIMEFNLGTGLFKREFPTNMMLQTIFTDGERLFGSGLSPRGFFHKYDSGTQKFIPLPHSNLPFIDRYNMADPDFNPFKIQGNYSTCDGCIVFGSSFEPIFYIYKYESQQLSQFKYESIPQVDYESGRIGNTLTTPRPLKMYVDKLISFDGHKIGVLARGGSDNRDYLSRNIHIFDLETQSHVTNISFPIELNDISISNRYIVTLSHESWEINVYEYKIY